MQKSQKISDAAQDVTPPAPGRMRPRVTLTCPEPTLTKQSFKEQSDVNNIVRAYQAQGVIPRLNPRAPRYGDVSRIPTYHDAQQIVKDTELAFRALPAKLRNYFKNDPGSFIDFVSDAQNDALGVEIGLFEAKTPKAPPEALKPQPASVDPGQK